MSHRRASTRLTIALAGVSLVAAFLIRSDSRASGPPVEPDGPRPFAPDAVLAWNAILLQANANDFDPRVVPNPDQAGPARTSRAFGIVHAAIFDAVNSIDRSFIPYLSAVPAAPNASIEAAVAQAAHDTLVALYPHQKPLFDQALEEALEDIPPGRARPGVAVGRAVAANILAARSNDGSDSTLEYTPKPFPGYHQPDPLHPNQGFFNPDWGSVRPFVLRDSSQFLPPDFVGTDRLSRLAWMQSDAYTQAFVELKAFGARFGSARTADQTEIGISWSYDGSPGLGTPPRLYNQIVRTIATRAGNSLVQNARLFGLVNLAMADAAVAAWECKYVYQFWRPIMGIRHADVDGNPWTVADPGWEPLGAQADNGSGTNFTPPFPSYVSGHATLGTAMFQTLRRFYGTDDIAFSFTSDEFNGVTSNGGVVRPRRVRYYRNLEQAEIENVLSRIYLGVHWRFDQLQGQALGRNVGNYVFENALLPR